MFLGYAFQTLDLNRLEADIDPLAPTDLVEWKRDQALACEQLDDVICEKARIEGQTMTVEQAIEYALSENS